MRRDVLLKVCLTLLLYSLVFSSLDLLRHFSYTQNSNDVAAFDQSLWYALHGKGPYNSIEGMSHFGIHNSPILYFLLPFYALAPSPVTLILFQCIATALAIGLIFLIGTKVLDERAGLYFAILLALYHPLHGVSWDILNELAYCIAPLLLMVYGYLIERQALLWVGAILSLLCKEEIGFVIAFFGLLLIIKHFFDLKKRWGVHGLLLVLIGAGWTIISLNIIIPHYRGGPYQYFSIENRYAEFGSSLGEILKHVVTRPVPLFRAALTPSKIFYCLELLAPLGFLSLAAPVYLWMTIPTLAANLLSNASMMSMVGARYPAAMIPFIFISAIFGTKSFLRKQESNIGNAIMDPRLRGDDTKSLSAHSERTLNRLFRTQFVLTILCTLLLNSTPLRFPFRKIPKITPHCAVVRSFFAQIPAGSIVATQPNFTAHVPHGCIVSPFFRLDADYVLLDPTFAQWYRDSKMTPQEIASKGYRLMRKEDGVLLFQR